MHIRVNKNTGASKHRHPVKYAALSSGTISDVWCDEDSMTSAPKRQNRIKMIRSRDKAVVTPDYDA